LQDPCTGPTTRHFSLFGVNGKVSAPEGVFVLFLEIPSLSSLIQPLLTEDGRLGLQSVTLVKKEAAKPGRAQLHLELHQADTGVILVAPNTAIFLSKSTIFLR